MTFKQTTGAYPAMRFPVYGFTADHRRETVATFFDQGAAVDLVLHPDEHGFEKRELYLAAAQYDRRTQGYRYVPMSPVVLSDLGDGWKRAAA